MIAKLRSWLYRHAGLKFTKLPAFVVSVGNISMGGTGKSPFVMLLAEKALASGLRTAVLTRGYKRKGRDMVIVRPHEQLPSVHAIGDEPWMIKNRVPGISLLVHADRGRKAAQYWRELGEPELVILDDGFQHWKVARDFDVVMVDATESLFAPAIPLGPMREAAAALGRADLVVITRSQSLSEAERVGLEAQVQGNLEKRVSVPWKPERAGSHSLVWADYQFSRYVDLRSGKTVETVASCEFVMITGIAKPAGFRALALSLGLKIAEEIAFPDHHHLTEKDIAKIVEALARLPTGKLLMSEKDATRWKSQLRDQPAISLEVHFQFTGLGESTLNALWANIFSEAKRCSILG